MLSVNVTPRMIAMPEQRAQHAQRQDRNVVQRVDLRRQQVQFEQLDAQCVDDGHGNDGGDGDRAERADGIGADHQLERIERAGQRGVEGAGDRRRRAAADQQAHVVAPDAERVTDFEAMAEPIWVYAASNPIEAPTPLEMMVCSTTTRLPVSDMRPPNSAFASIGSTARRA